MHIALDIPDNIPNVVAPDRDPARAALEAMALEGYRSQRPSEYDVRELLGFTTPIQVHGFLRNSAFTCTIRWRIWTRHSRIRPNRRNAERAQVLWRATRGMIVVADTGPPFFLD